VVWRAACPESPTSAGPRSSPGSVTQPGSHVKQVRAFAGLAPKASETGDTDRKGQALSKAGPSLSRATFVIAADTARKQDPRLARIYYVQMVERGKNHIGALCVVAATLAERAWTVMKRQTPYVIRDINGSPVGPQQAAAIIAEHWTVPCFL
jgi:transposase IS116/IS110/IS902 family protein